MTNAAQTADNSIAAYEAFIFSSVGRAAADVLPKADLLALSAALDCDDAAADKSLPAWARRQYTEVAAEMRAYAS